MAGDGKKVATHRADIEWQVAGALGGVDEREGADLFRRGAEFGRGIDDTEGVGNVDEREDLHLGRKHLGQLHKVEQAGVARDNGQVAELGAGAAREQLPRHHVAVVLHLGKQDDVALLEVFVAPRIGDEVDAVGRAGGEDNLARLGGVEEFRGAFTGGFVAEGGAHRERVDATVDVGVVLPVIVRERVDDALRFLRRGGVVEIDERVPVDLLAKDGEISADVFPSFVHFL